MTPGAPGQGGSGPHGILHVDKRAGMSSHDVVWEARKVFGTRSVGHAGTLDPMATGLLVLGVGEGTKLVPWLTAEDKRYRAEIRFGWSTDSLDADGAPLGPVVERAVDEARLRAVLAEWKGTHPQVPPQISAIKVAGESAHARVRRGEDVQLAPREVTLHEACVLGVHGARAQLDLHVSKGFYVRSLVRDLCATLGMPGHLSALRRTAVGTWSVDDAVPGDTLARAARAKDAEAMHRTRQALRPLTACGRLETRVDGPTALALRQGKCPPSEGPEGEVIVVAEPTGVPVCMARREDGVLRVVRGFAF